MDTLTEYLEKNTPEGFNPRPRYHEDSDAVVLFFRRDDSYASRLDHLVTIYRSVASDELVGCKIKGVKALLDELGEFGVHVKQKQDVDIRLLFYAQYKASTDSTIQHTYKELAEEVSRVDPAIPNGDLVAS